MMLWASNPVHTHRRCRGTCNTNSVVYSTGIITYGCTRPLVIFISAFNDHIVIRQPGSRDWTGVILHYIYCYRIIKHATHTASCELCCIIWPTLLHVLVYYQTYLQSVAPDMIIKLSLDEYNDKIDVYMLSSWH